MCYWGQLYYQGQCLIYCSFIYVVVRAFYLVSWSLSLLKRQANTVQLTMVSWRHLCNMVSCVTCGASEACDWLRYTYVDKSQGYILLAVAHYHYSSHLNGVQGPAQSHHLCLNYTASTHFTLYKPLFTHFYYYYDKITKLKLHITITWFQFKSKAFLRSRMIA